MDSFFDLPLGFVYIQIGIAGTVIGLIACVVSLIVWLSRGDFLSALAPAFVVLALPPMIIGIIPGAEAVAVPGALLAAFITFFLHFKRMGSGEGSMMDKILSLVLGLSLAAIVIAYALGSLTAVDKA